MLEDLRALAIFVGNGEAFWPLSVAASVAQAAADRGLGILGGEVYLARGRAWGNMELDWLTAPGLRDGERWDDYVKRGLEQALSALTEAQTTFSNGSADGEMGEPKCFLACQDGAGQPARLSHPAARAGSWVGSGADQ